MPSVAVVIPLFNHEAYIAEALRSVLEQTRAVEKIIVVDDGSSDRSVEVVRSIGDTRIELLTQANAGAHTALNRGIVAASACDYIAILNSDDRFHPARVERCVAFLETNREMEVVCTGLTMIDETGCDLDAANPKARRLSTVWALRTTTPEWLGLANFAKTTSNIAARSSYLLAHPFRAYRYAHDYFFLVCCALADRLGVIDERLLSYRTHSSNTIKSAPERVRAETVVMNLDLLRELAPELADSPAMRCAASAYFRVLMGNHSDFRAELFLLVVSAAMAGTPEGHAEKLLDKDFIELRASASGLFREKAAESELAEWQRWLRSSRWIALGRVLGTTRPVGSSESGDARSRLALLKKQVARSRWLQLGRRLGFFVPSVR